MVTILSSVSLVKLNLLFEMACGIFLVWKLPDTQDPRGKREYIQLRLEVREGGGRREYGVPVPPLVQVHEQNSGLRR